MRKFMGTAVLIAAIASGIVSAQPISPEWVDRWAADLRHLRDRISEVHPGPYDHVSSEELDGAFDDLIARLPLLQHDRIVVEMAGLIARLRDGHSRVTLPLPDDAGFFLGHSPTPAPDIPGLVFRPLPIRLLLFADGLHILRIGQDHARVAGWRVTAIGGKSIEEVMAAVAQVIHHDNEMQLALQLPDYLVLPQVLQALGIVASAEQVTVTAESPDRESVELRLAPVRDGEAVAWVDARPADVATPLYLERVEDNFWFDYLEESRTVYWQYNEVYATETETTRQYAGRLFEFIERNDVERLIIDLRWNRGGDNGNNLPLLHGLIACDKLHHPGSLYVIVGRGTFSAAMMFAVDLEKHTPALFVGELTGSTPNHYGDSRKVRLPNSGVTVRLSTLYWQNSDPRDSRPGIAPHLAADLRVADYRAGRDPAMVSILGNHGNEPDMSGEWRGLVNLGNAEYQVALRLREGDEGWIGAVDVLGTSLQDLPLRAPRVAAGSLSARIDLGSQVIDIAVRPLDGRLVGWIGTESVDYPFALSK